MLGQPFFVMGFVPGVIPADLPRCSQEGFLVDEATPEQRARMVRSGLEAMARIHAVDWRAAGLDWLDASGTGQPTQPVQLDLYRRFVVDQLAGREHPVLRLALDWLEANDPQDERVGLSWGDSRLGNVICQDDEPAVICDWEAASLCPTEADLGWWLTFDRMSFDDPRYWEMDGAMRFCAIFIPLADRMVSAGLMPESLNMPVANMVTDALARLLGFDNPTPSAF